MIITKSYSGSESHLALEPTSKIKAFFNNKFFLRNTFRMNFYNQELFLACLSNLIKKNLPNSKSWTFGRGIIRVHVFFFHISFIVSLRRVGENFKCITDSVAVSITCKILRPILSHLGL